MLDAFRIADDTLRQGIQGVTDLITIPGLINLDFADIRTVMKDAGTAMMGIGLASGDNRALDAAQQAINSNLLEASIAGASRVLFSIAGGPDLTLAEVDEAARSSKLLPTKTLTSSTVRSSTSAGRPGSHYRYRNGFKTKAPQQPSIDFGRRDPHLTLLTLRLREKPALSAPTVSSGRFADEDYIPDFLKRR